MVLHTCHHSPSVTTEDRLKATDTIVDRTSASSWSIAALRPLNLIRIKFRFVDSTVATIYLLAT